MKKIFPNEDLITTQFFNVGQDWEIPIPGFFIIASLRNMKSILEFTDTEAAEFIDLVRRVRKGMRDVLNIEEVYFFQNEDTDHGFHFWMFPRQQWMEKFGRKIESVRPIMKYAEEHMANDDIFREIRGNVAAMKDYLKDN